ncbi:inovirus-type Gp2 protein [Paraburkholderia unamae]|uniref:Uncharacterized protein DUF3296 n=1 Tax=Paraburkholderia unamae TaxID=219649 RepID=A0ABX5KVN9_9BURK|nr:inovirus-type Gp2 protein [Paraburkholderia unamae]PVX97659.1 uncharacterized protein DUF3296 [Paraburkholderia unamae]
MYEKNWNAVEANHDESWGIAPYEARHFELRKGKVVPESSLITGSIASDVDYITQCVMKIIDSNRQLFTTAPVTELGSPKGKLGIKLSKAGVCFIRCLRMDLDHIVNKYPSIETYNRYFGIFCKAVMRDIEFEEDRAPFVLFAKEEWLAYRDWETCSNGMLTRIVSHLNTVVDEIRREGHSEAFRDWKGRLLRQPNENEERLWSLVLACLSVNHHINVLRVDLGYAQYYCDRELSGENAIEYPDVRAHRIALRRFLKRDLKKYVKNPAACRGMAFAIKMEFGLDKTYHFHVIVILNGDVVGQDASVAQAICDYWQEVITGGKGGAYNCNRAIYTDCGIGSIRYHDEEKLDNLKTIVVPYVTKVDYYVSMTKPEGHRSFWMSHPPKIEAKRRGRKRGKGVVTNEAATKRRSVTM